MLEALALKMNRLAATFLVGLVLLAGCAALAGIEDLQLDPGGTGAPGGAGGAGGAGGGGTGSKACDPQGDDCGKNASCVDQNGAFVCVCDQGYVDLAGGCDFDECAATMHDCDVNATCGNTAGSFTCTCNQGYTGNGKTCDIDPNSYVLDISPLTVKLKVDTIGEFEISGLSRLGWDIEVISDAPNGNLKPKSPGKVSYLPWRVRLIAGDQADLEALETWADGEINTGGSPRELTVELVGRDSESLGLKLQGASPSEGDLTINKGALAELLFVYQGATLYFFGPPTTGDPDPAKRLELDDSKSTAADFSYDAELTVANDSDQPPLSFVAAPGPKSALYSTFFDIIDMPSKRWKISVLEMYGSTEKLRTDCSGAWPSSVSFFNPLKAYGTEFLVDATFAVSFCDSL